MHIFSWLIFLLYNAVYYFRRSFATGLSVCGSGVGTFLIAPLTETLVREYGGWRGATVVLAGLVLNMCVCGALYRDLEWTIKKRTKKKTKKLRKRNSTVSDNSQVSSTSKSLEAVVHF